MPPCGARRGGVTGTGELRDRIVREAERHPAATAVLERAEELARFLALLLEANETMNLVSHASSRPEVLVGEHLFDALAGLPFLPPASEHPRRLLDVGSGGGFPAVPLLLVRRDLEGTLVDSTGKKCRFLELAVRELGLTATIVNARFPSLPMPPTQRFDVLTTRAVAGAGKLVRGALPILSREARVLLWTTRPLFEEAVREAGIHSLGFHGTPGAERRGIGVLECST
ncbi:MAG: 16S rRNA (guanine(527)-N(7))-methyltransferase RsmG [Acidobacteria bacterium]|nr:MAG: 16S rRNA (guanine(527)-N(7))-methyltransferase RsmG [Acidobacteriota bacterium]MCE7958364.1 16S rRNA (guanine(527)-N(7))-methyltransferase RsmG [Acidobacteria bacterium ACB2]